MGWNEMGTMATNERSNSGEVNCLSDLSEYRIEKEKFTLYINKARHFLQWLFYSVGVPVGIEPVTPGFFDIILHRHPANLPAILH